MTHVKAAWLRQGYFQLGKEGLMPGVRAALEQTLQLTSGHFSIEYFPSRAKWKHICWWREGKDAYAEAQFFAQIAKAYPVLSLGLAVEKGFTTAPAGVKPKPEQMMTPTWDWHRVLPALDTVLSEDLPAIAATVGDITLRIRTSTEVGSLATPKSERLWRRKAFTYADGTWHERYVGAVDVGTITEHLRLVDVKPDVWAILHLSHDLSPAEADGLTAPQLAHVLRQFDGVRRRLRGLPVAEAVLV